MHNNKNLLEGIHHIHFIGIGGSGMYPLVQILHKEGYKITGSDNNETDTLAAERAMGIEITLGHSKDNINGADMIVYTAAILSDNEELIAAKNSGKPCIERSIMLGYITSRYKKAICISGTHGKTTTSSMATQILLDAGLDPSAVIGGKLPSIGGNGRAGKSELMVCEACEFVDTFLKLHPDICVILNIDEDHLDYFKTLDNIILSFNKFAKMATDCVIVNGDDENSLKALDGVNVPIITFGFSDKNDYSARNIKSQLSKDAIPSTSFDVYHKGEFLTDITIHVPGEHNILNALAATVAAIRAGATENDAKAGFENFFGAGRRFQILGNINGITIADDYAHHPKELEVTLNAAMQMGYNNVYAVFQPFTYSRTKILLDDFAKALAIPDYCVMSEIMGSREKNTYNIYTKDLAEKIDGSVWFNTFEEIADYVMKNAKDGDLVITLGCGDIYKAAKLMLNYNK